MYRGGFADVWKGEHQGRQVAVKVLRVYSTSDFEKITGVGSYNLSKVRVDQLMLTIVEVLQGGCDLEGPPPQKRSATVGSDNESSPLRDGIGVDEKWEHQ